MRVDRWWGFSLHLRCSCEWAPLSPPAQSGFFFPLILVWGALAALIFLRCLAGRWRFRARSSTRGRNLQTHELMVFSNGVRLSYLGHDQVLAAISEGDGGICTKYWAVCIAWRRACR